MDTLTTIGTIVGIIVGVFAFLYYLTKIFGYIKETFKWVKIQIKKRPWIFGFFFVIVFLLAVVGFFLPNHLDYIIDEELKYIAPQLAEIPLTYTTTYATNGRVTSEFHDDTVLEGREYYTKIVFQNFFPEQDSNSGWVISRLKGYNASKFEYISFWVKGENGGEKFGIKMKDTRGTETKVIVMEYVGEKDVTKNWQRVIIPLNKFRQVDRSSLDCISVYTNGNLSGIDPIAIYVTDLKLY